MNTSSTDGPRKSQAGNKTKVLRDPVHDLIYLGPEDNWVVDVIDTKEFQRLRRIRQLGIAHLVYPGAEHTRFTHSLGVFNFARRIIGKLLDRPAADNSIHEALNAKSRTVKVAALVHDLGHGPFSHVFERVFKEEKRKPRRHDEWSCHILRDEKTQIHKALAGVEDVNIDTVCSLISDSEEPRSEPYLKDIVSSQLDADRMDYLLRDSLMTGSRYGQFDSEWVLNALAIRKTPLVPGQPKKLCLDASKGTGGIEGLLFARRLMLEYVYGHKTTRAYEAELIQTLRLALHLKDELPGDTPAPVRTVLEKGGDVSTKEYLMLDDEVMWWALRLWSVWDGAGARDRKLASALARHARRLVRRERPWKSVRVRADRILLLRNRIKEMVAKDGRVEFECYIDTLEDLPYKDYWSLRREAPRDDEERALLGEIFLVDRVGKVDRLAEATESPIVQALTKPLQVSRFHYDREFSEEFTGLVTEFGVC